ncbi:MAG: HDOD domain-containing protein [Vicinamibacterales bacterium]|nr:HDOD domain-containing protein [Vicinamibacterales bacterium]
MPIPAAVLAGFDHLAPLPVTAQRLVSLLSSDEVSLARVASLIEYDQVIAARVLRMARSAAYAGRMPADTVREAVVRLGTATVLELVLGDYLQTLRVSAPMYDLAEDELWAHGAATSLAVRALMAERPRAGIPGMALTAGLVHDIGKLLMVRTLKAQPAEVQACCEAHGVTWVEAERTLFGCDHAEVGAAMARAWSFPEPMVDTIARHHDSPLAPPTPMLDAVVTANLAAKSIGVGLGAEGLNLNVDGGAAARLGLDFAAFARVSVQTAVWLKDLKEAHGVAA